MEALKIHLKHWCIPSGILITYIIITYIIIINNNNHLYNNNIPDGIHVY